MRIRVIHGIDDLASDMAAIPPNAVRDMSDTVREMGRMGSNLARGFARSKAGPHGSNYYKRITSEMKGPLTAEYGPEGVPKTDFVGVGFRHGGENLDLPNSADIVAPRFAAKVAKLPDWWFW